MINDVHLVPNSGVQTGDFGNITHKGKRIPSNIISGLGSVAKHGVHLDRAILHSRKQLFGVVDRRLGGLGDIPGRVDVLKGGLVVGVDFLRHGLDILQQLPAIIGMLQRRTGHELVEGPE